MLTVLLLIVTELPTPKFSTTVPAAPAILKVTFPLPALILFVNVSQIPDALGTVLSLTSGL